MILTQIYQKYKFDLSADRLGRDCPFTHWRLYFKKTMIDICKKKFKYFGDNAEFRAGAYAVTCSKISIGKRVIIRPNCMFFADPREDISAGCITIEDNVMLGSGVHIYVANHRYDLQNLDLIDQGHFDPKDVVLKQGCWIGANSIILSGVTVGKNSIVGAGSIVTKSIPDRALYAGNPAKFIKNI